MAGYSGTPLPKKLGIKPGHRVAVIGAPRDAMATIAEIAAGGPVQLKFTGSQPYDVILAFCDSQRTFASRFDAAKARLIENGGLWVAWPKQSSGIETDLNENIIRMIGLASGLVDNKVCAIDETWSGLRFVVRVADRTSAPQRRRGTEKKGK